MTCDRAWQKKSGSRKGKAAAKDAAKDSATVEAPEVEAPVKGAAAAKEVGGAAAPAGTGKSSAKAVGRNTESKTPARPQRAASPYLPCVEYTRAKKDPGCGPRKRKRSPRSRVCTSRATFFTLRLLVTVRTVYRLHTRPPTLHHSSP